VDLTGEKEKGQFCGWNTNQLRENAFESNQSWKTFKVNPRGQKAGQAEEEGYQGKDVLM